MRLHINIDHVATLRNQRDAGYPDPLEAARICVQAGADGITVHLREDRRHIRDADVRSLKAAGLGVLNLEMAATKEMVVIMKEILPSVVTLVPERREERTTEGGLDVIARRAEINEVAAACRQSGVKLSLFIEAREDQVRASHELGAGQVEFHTGHYCEAAPGDQPGLASQIEQAAKLATALGLEVAAGHGLNRDNVGPIARIPEILELNIGHSVIADAVFMGLGPAVTALRNALISARG